MLTELVENLLNRNLGASPRARELCTALRGRRLRITLSGLGVRIGLESLGSTLRISRDPDGDFDAEVEGSPVNLIALAGPSPEHLLRSGTVQVRGDTELLQRYRELGLLLRPDLEEELSRFVGDAPAHQVMRFAGSAFGFGRHAADTAVRNAAEYFAHERGDLVPAAEAEAFMSDVDRLREDIDRAEAQTAHLEARLAATTEPAP
jgi:ubiquinone biosynthesis protein UbiJ